MRVAIIGTGLSGLATGWFLLKNAPSRYPIHLTFFDSIGIGGGASGMAAGLMHPYAGASAKLNRKGLEGYQATCKLLQLASEKVGKPVVMSQGLLRLAITDRQKAEYHLSAQRYENIIWQEAAENIQNIPGLSFHPGIFIKDCLTIDCPLYLEGLWIACQEKGAVLIKSTVNSMQELKDFDQIVLATGASVNKLLTDPQLPITAVKGQILELNWPTHLKPLTFALNSHAYILMNNEKNACTIGATYERSFDTALPDIDYALQDILPKAIAMLPALKDVSLLNCKAGIRASTPNHMPIIQKVNSNCWVLTGMGSKGLLYHALYSEKLAHQMALLFN